MPRVHSSHRGDLYVHLAVTTPTRLDAEQEGLLRDLAAIRDERVSISAPRSGGFFGKMRDAFNSR
jgi:molecular chaperone DnaJ